jgi:anti-sigma regulatory factor (Ser/Thr protein kinase)
MEHTLTLHNDVQEVPLLATFIDTICEENAMDMEMSMNINLAVEEAVVNVMNYAYPEGTVGEVRIDASVTDGLLTIIISDSGTPFDPTGKEDPDINLPAEERAIGGLGILLVRQFMDTVTYQHTDGKNILILMKKLN